MGYLFAVRSGRGVSLYEYEMRYITRRGLRREEEEEEKDGMGKTRQGKAGALYDTCILYVSFIPSFYSLFLFSFRLKGDQAKKAKRERRMYQYL